LSFGFEPRADGRRMAGAARTGADSTPLGTRLRLMLAPRVRSRPHDHPERETSDDVFLCHPREARRASDDAASARQQRSAASQSQPRDRTAPAPASLDSRRLRQLRRDRRFFGRDPARLDVENNITLEHIAPDEPDFLLEDRARYNIIPSLMTRKKCQISPGRLSGIIPTPLGTLSARSDNSSITGGRPRRPRCS
jgi:hypothetical protein